MRPCGRTESRTCQIVRAPGHELPAGRRTDGQCPGARGPSRAGIELAAGRPHRIEAIEPTENGFARALKCLRVLAPPENQPLAWVPAMSRGAAGNPHMALCGKSSENLQGDSREAPGRPQARHPVCRYLSSKCWAHPVLGRGGADTEKPAVRHAACRQTTREPIGDDNDEVCPGP